MNSWSINNTQIYPYLSIHMKKIIYPNYAIIVLVHENIQIYNNLTDKHADFWINDLWYIIQTDLNLA